MKLPMSGFELERSLKLLGGASGDGLDAVCGWQGAMPRSTRLDLCAIGDALQAVEDDRGSAPSWTGPGSAARIRSRPSCAATFTHAGSRPAETCGPAESPLGRTMLLAGARESTG